MQQQAMVVKRDFEPDELVTLHDFMIILENTLEDVPFEGLPHDMDGAQQIIMDVHYVDFDLPDEWFVECDNFVDAYYKERKEEYKQDKYFESRSAEPDEDWGRDV